MRYSWVSMLRTSRAPVAVLTVGGIGLTVPPQTRDMLAFLNDGRFWPVVGFQIVLCVFGVSIWFWSRAALAARFGLDDTHRSGIDEQFDWAVFVWLPRLMLVGAFLVGIVIALMSSTIWPVGWILGVGALGLLLTIVRPRGRPIMLPPAPRGDLRFWIREGAKARFHALLHRAPLGQWPAIVLLALGVVPLVVGVVEAFTSVLQLPNRAAALLPGPEIAVLLLGLMIGPLTTTTFVIDGLRLRARVGSFRLGLSRPPVLSVLALYVFVLIPAWLPIHTVRLIERPMPNRMPLDQILAQWVNMCAPASGPVQPIIVSVSGGATRAGLWGAAVIDRVLQAQRENGPSLFAISSVSGGSLGVAGAMTLLSRERLPCRATGLPSLRPRAGGVPLSGDALGPLLAGWLLNDIPRSALDPLAALVRSVTGYRPNGGDSAEAIEQAFQNLWSAARPKDAPRWDQTFLSLFYEAHSQAYRTGMPLWFANGTDATTGNRVITAPIAAPMSEGGTASWPFRGARDFHTLMQRDVSIATAINNTARFPYLEPFGQMVPASSRQSVGSLVDGGYFDNEGLQTALELAEWLKMQSRVLGRPVWPIIVQATGDGEVDVGPHDVMTCDNVSDGPWIPSHHSSWQILAPLFGLYHVRGGHSAVLLRRAHDDFCPGRFFHFYLPADGHHPVPLNWVLSNATARFIWHAFDNGQVLNGTELKGLQAALNVTTVR